MAIYNISTVKGGWVDKKTLKSGTKAKLVSETSPVPSSFAREEGKPQTQDVAQVLLQGEKEPKNINVNRQSLAALAEAFGPDSANWIGKVVTLEVEKAQIAGKRVTVAYLVPDGYQVKEDLAGYVHVEKIAADDGVPVINLEEEPGQGDDDMPGGF